jgi:hypothetical protein
MLAVDKGTTRKVRINLEKHRPNKRRGGEVKPSREYFGFLYLHAHGHPFIANLRTLLLAPCALLAEGVTQN